MSMIPKKMWRVEYPIDSGQRGVLAICGEGAEHVSVFVGDGKEKVTTHIQSYHRDRDIITTYGDEPTNYRMLSEIPITDGTKKIRMMVVSAAVNPNAKAP